jgi:hypothetical protein
MTALARAPMRAAPGSRRALALLVVHLVASTARAAGPLGPNGTPIRTSSYGVDMTQTPVMAGARVTGLAGAYVAIAEGTDGDIQTPVAAAVRPAHALEHFDYEFALGLTLPATLTSTDFFNTGHTHTQLSDADQRGFVFVTPALNLVWGTFGISGTAELSNYRLRRTDEAAFARHDELVSQFAIGHVQAAQAFDEGAFVVGAGLRILSLGVTNPGAPPGQTDLFNSAGTGFELGVLWKSPRLPFRVGAAFRTAVTTTPDPKSAIAANAEGDRVIGNPASPVDAIWLPERLEEPWDLNVGVAVQLGPRPFNPPWVDPDVRNETARRAVQRRSAERAFRRERRLRQAAASSEDPAGTRAADDAALDDEEAIDELHVRRIREETRRALKERYARLPRPYVLISASVVVTGPVRECVGVESFLQRVVARSGEHTVYSPRLGIESELVPAWVKARAGTYIEPTRFASSSPRVHGTVGFDAKILDWTVFGLFDDGTEWRASTSLDAAARYLGWGVSVGVWH